MSDGRRAAARTEWPFWQRDLAQMTKQEWELLRRLRHVLREQAGYEGTGDRPDRHRRRLLTPRRRCRDYKNRKKIVPDHQLTPQVCQDGLAARSVATGWST